MEIRKISLSDDYANNYLLINGGEAILFDAGFNLNHALEKYIDDCGVKLLGIFITHGHFDHFFALKYWNKESMPPVFFPKDDADALTDPDKNVSARYFCAGETVELTPYLLEDGDETKIGSFTVRTIQTPYHTNGSSCFYVEEANALFSGDSLFAGGFGRTDLPTGDANLRGTSLAKIAKLPAKTIVYPGHGEITVLGNEISRF
ncbi:MAG: MBL fold metallo-hydrolase [Bacilli bacterium]|nr:MBL fold metallo-hydrolase [Bacilli bacterium]